MALLYNGPLLCGFNVTVKALRLLLSVDVVCIQYCSLDAVLQVMLQAVYYNI